MDKLNNYIIQAINGSVLNTDPFPYTYVENIFPQDFYNKVCSLTPSDELLALAGTKPTHKVIVESRYTFPLSDKDVDNSKELMLFFQWAKMFLMPIIGKRLGIEYDYNTKQLRGAFVKDDVDYLKRPHTDHPTKLFTMLLYMSDSPTGTTILKPKQQEFTDSYGNDHPYKEFDEIITYPFKPNSALLFARTDNSFHCVRKVKDNLPRRALHLHVWNQ